MKGRCMIVGPKMMEQLALRYMGIGKPLNHDETELLLFDLYLESLQHDGLMKRVEPEALKLIGGPVK